jgi:hypothetical protein
MREKCELKQPRMEEGWASTSTSPMIAPRLQAPRLGVARPRSGPSADPRVRALPEPDDMRNHGGGMDVRALQPRDYDQVIASDKAVYPTASPMAADAMARWYRNNPEFGIAFEQNGTLCGICVAIPLNTRGWTDLISGRLSESQVDDSAIFKEGIDNAIGIHIYHIEKHPAWGSAQPFYKAALHALRGALQHVQRADVVPDVIGFSGLCVTAQGIRLFADTFNCRERDFVSTEHILKKNGKIEVFDAASPQALADKLSDDYEHLNRCKMLVSYPGESSVVWEYLGIGA